MNFFQKIKFILTKENSSKLVIFFFLMLLTVFFEALGVALALPAITFIIDSDLNTNSENINQILSYFNENFDRIYLIKFIFILIFIAFVLKNIILFLFLWWNKNFIEYIYRNICMRLLQAELQKSYIDYVNSNSALTVRNFNEVKAFLKYLENFIILLVEGIILFLLIILLLTVEYKVTLIVFSIVIFLVLIFKIITKQLVKNYGTERFFRSGEMMKSLMEILDNYKNIKVFNTDKFFINIFKKNNYIYSNVNKKFQVIDNSPRFWLEIAGVTGLCGIVFVLLYFEYSPESIIPILGIFSVAFFRIIPSVLRIVRSAQAINYSDPVIDQLLISLKDSKEYVPEKNFEIFIFNKKIELKNLSFNYPNKSNKIFDNLNLKIKKGEKIGILGRTGAGKSTLIDIILGFYKPTKGDVLVDNKESETKGIEFCKSLYGENTKWVQCSYNGKIRGHYPSAGDYYNKEKDQNLRGWRELIGYVPQKINVINGTIRENIIFGSNILDDKNLIKKLEKSIAISEFDEVIKGLNDGLETIIGEKGLDLSGGQIQRLALARALFKSPKILILDESTNALDQKTENKIIKNLIDYASNKTLIMISHNYETLNFCDCKYELKNFYLNKINE